MKISLKNFRGIASADIEIDGIALVAGVNGSGKTSLATALSAALMGNASPVPGMTKTDARQYLRDHQERGRVILESQEGKTQVNYPGCTVSSEGSPPRSTPMGCGLVNVAAMAEKTKAAYFIEALQASPKKEDLAQAFKDNGISDKALESCWEKICSDGWDKTHGYALTRATEFKGAWQQITGERWGSQKSAEWRPSVLPEGDLDHHKFESEFSIARKNLEDAIADQAVSASEVEKITAMANSQIPDIESMSLEVDEEHKKHEEISKQVQDAVSQVLAAKTQMQSLPQPGQAIESVPCPSCGDHLIVVSNSVLELASRNQISDAENKKRTEAIESARQKILDLQKIEMGKRQELSLSLQEVQKLREKIASAKKAKSEIANARAELSSIKSDGQTSEQIQLAREKLAEAEHMLASLAQFYEAAKKHSAIEAMLKMAEVLAPTGLRSTFMKKSINGLNNRLRELCAAAKWGSVLVSDDLEISYSSRRFDMLSAAEQFRVRVSMQAVFSEIDGSQVLVIDAADILDRAGRSGLVAMLLKLSKTALVTMTMNEAKDVPDLSKTGRGQSYWASDATIKPTSVFSTE